ncbi:hypothetical protein NTE_00836 [Candidatus Nitrososphaera evergladensis SR1]|uniref:BED-type domain-containing protein n=1 Tax=Candidatus Nitrososphaera evergladensis SR1 TaxID=1459636 RepID=A0A075MPX3_9ARCH|nr:hypothetical protein [Candidatus Nitrososphaera evergladensis]AIF82912.1 hypothetical protein NTE_00836 [Candidatus Nitrososphaera evergladensis SR1]
MAAAYDEHIVKCSICGRALIVKDTVNNGVAFLSHLKIDHGITYFVQQMTTEEAKAAQKRTNQTLAPLE